MIQTAATHPGTSYSVPLLEGDAGTGQTVELMRQAVRAGLQDPLVWQTARRIYPASTYSDDPGQVRKVFEWVKKKIRFMRDPYGQETVSTPDRTLRQGFGDCDDITVLMAALLGSLGYRTRIVTVAGNPHTEQFTHVYPEVSIRGRWMPVDAARPRAAFGKTVPRYSRKRVWDVTSGAHQDVAGLNGEHAQLGAVQDWLPDVFKGVTDIVRTVRTPRSQLSPPASPGSGLPSFGAGASAFGVDTTTLLIGAAIVAAVVFLARKKR